MAKSYTISTTLDSKQVELGLRQVNSLITATTREANSMNKACLLYTSPSPRD